MNLFECESPQREETRYTPGIPKSIQLIAFIHLWSLLSCLASLSAAEVGSCTLDAPGILTCISINSSSSLLEGNASVKRLVIRDSPHLELQDLLLGLQSFQELKALSVENCSLSEFVVLPEDDDEKEETFSSSTLEELNLSNNKLVKFQWRHLRKLTLLNLSSNLLRTFQASVFEDMTSLQELHLDHNLLDKSMLADTFMKLPKTLTLLNISENQYQCSPELSWIYDWNLGRDVISDVESTQCHYDNSNYKGHLLLVMEYYSKYIIPSCPTDVGCLCLLTSVQEKMVHSKDRTYSVQVNCARSSLNYFPKLPKHTRSVDLSGNLINGSAFETLQVIEQNYDEVDNLTINDNKLESLPEKILEMRLGLSFSARNNKLKSISYDISQRLVRTTTVVELSGNPWRCSCRSQITDVILIEKVRDKSHLICGPDSDGQLQNEKIMSLNPQILCAPSPSGEIQETFLKLLCVLFAILIVIVFAKLGYDYWVYRTRGQLPWLVLKMP